MTVIDEMNEKILATILVCINFYQKHSGPWSRSIRTTVYRISSTTQVGFVHSKIDRIFLSSIL